MGFIWISKMQRLGGMMFKAVNNLGVIAFGLLAP